MLGLYNIARDQRGEPADRIPPAYGSNDGLDVTLLWHPTADELVVPVLDQRQHVGFEIRPERHMALEVYYHPYTYLSPADAHDALAAT